MQRKTVYFEDIDTKDTIIRKRQNLFELEYISKRNPVWKKTRANSSYEREYYLGQGNGCLFEITYEDAKGRLAQWGVEI